jgi:hypothetical protein
MTKLDLVPVGKSAGKAAKEVDAKLRKMKSEVSKLMKQVADDARDDVKSDWPVVTGRSKRGFKTRKQSQGAELRNDVDYSGHVRDGKADREIQRFIDAHDDEVQDMLNELFQETMDF